MPCGFAATTSTSGAGLDACAAWLAGEDRVTVGGAEVVVAVPVDPRVGVPGDQVDEPFVDRGDREGLVLDPRLGVFEQREAIDDLFDRDVGLRVDPDLDAAGAASARWVARIDRNRNDYLRAANGDAVFTG